MASISSSSLSTNLFPSVLKAEAMPPQGVVLRQIGLDLAQRENGAVVAAPGQQRQVLEKSYRQVLGAKPKIAIQQAGAAAAANGAQRRSGVVVLRARRQSAAVAHPVAGGVAAARPANEDPRRFGKVVWKAKPKVSVVASKPDADASLSGRAVCGAEAVIAAEAQPTEGAAAAAAANGAQRQSDLVVLRVQPQIAATAQPIEGAAAAAANRDPGCFRAVVLSAQPQNAVAASNALLSGRGVCGAEPMIAVAAQPAAPAAASAQALQQLQLIPGLKPVKSYKDVAAAAAAAAPLNEEERRKKEKCCVDELGVSRDEIHSRANVAIWEIDKEIRNRALQGRGTIFNIEIGYGVRSVGELLHIIRQKENFRCLIGNVEYCAKLCLDKNKIDYKYHANKRKEQREVSEEEVGLVIQRGKRVSYADDFDRALGWSYRIEASPEQIGNGDRTLRVIISFEEGQMAVISVITPELDDAGRQK